MKNSLKSFYNLGINNNLLYILNKLNYKNPFPIQQLCIPKILKNIDILGIANTGSGKTIAFILPILNKINSNLKYTQSLILTPTRELTIQINNVINLFTKYLKNINSIPIYGGQNFSLQVNLLKLIRHIIVGTPGRIIDHIEKKTINLSNISILVIDEADEMFKMGFINDIKKIINKIPYNKQTLLFSATMPYNLKNTCLKFIKKNNFEEILITKENIKYNIKQYYYLLNFKDNKYEILIRFLSITKFNSLIIFVNMKKNTINLFNYIKKFNYKCLYLNGDMKQYNREKTIKTFKNNKNYILISTDVASRGLDINSIDLIINFDFPLNEDSYIHRIGRTGRAGNTGKSISLVNYKELKLLKSFKKNNLNIKNIELTNKDNNFFNNIKIDNIIKFINKNNIINNENFNNNYNEYLNKLLRYVNNNNNNLIKILLLYILTK